MSYEQMLVRVKELENDNIVLRCQMKPVVVYNKELGTFEYISNPIPLMSTVDHGGPSEQQQVQELQDIEDFIASLKAWLGRSENQSLTVRTIFESLDLQNFGELTDAKFEIALRKIGVDMRPKEKRMLKEVLDPRNIGFMKYRPLLRELQGIPQLDFISNEVTRLAVQIVEVRDLDEPLFKKLVDPNHLEMMTLDQLKESILQIRNEHFKMSSEEVEILFKTVTKCQRTLGVNISITKLTERVFHALDALIIDKMRDAVAKSMKPLNELFARYDANKDGMLEYLELENLLLEC